MVYKQSFWVKKRNWFYVLFDWYILFIFTVFKLIIYLLEMYIFDLKVNLLYKQSSGMKASFHKEINFVFTLTKTSFLEFNRPMWYTKYVCKIHNVVNNFNFKFLFLFIWLLILFGYNHYYYLMLIWNRLIFIDSDLSLKLIKYLFIKKIYK